MTTGAGPFTSLVSAHDAPPLPQTNRETTAILENDAVSIEFLPFQALYDLTLVMRNFLQRDGVD
jgi:hypothetical protein